MDDFYVYVHRKLSNDSVFYVGKGRKNRAWTTCHRSKYWNNVAAKHGIRVEIVQSNMQESKAFLMEREFIEYFGRNNLVNLTDGGEGISGFVHSDETRKKLSIAHMGKRTGFKLSAEHKAKISAGNMGRKVSDANIDRIRKIWTGRKHTDEARRKISIAQIGKTISAETRAKLSIAGTGKKLSEETKQKLRGRIVSAETIQRIKEGQKRVPVKCSNGIVFESVMDAKRWLIENGKPNASHSAISRCLAGGCKTAYGYKWIKT